MMTVKEKYIKAIIDACNEVKLNYFPQVEASELLYRVITLEDLYLPLSLRKSQYNELSYESATYDVEIDELIRRIDEQIAELEALEAEEARKASGAADTAKENEPSASSEKQAEQLITEASDSGLRILITANPGSGKTTFCKRLILATLNHEDSFFKKYSQENDLRFNRDALPILISCKNIHELAADELTSLNFPQVLFRLCALNFGKHFSEITEAEFVELIGSCEGKNLSIIIDGWDEILDAEKEELFLKSLNGYLEQNPSVDAIITIRGGYVTPKLALPYSGSYMICPLSDDDVREFCNIWCDKILGSNQQRASSYSQLSEQILSSDEPQVKLMMRNPLDLSLLLTVSKNDGRLPENKAELFKELVELYIYWSSNKSADSLSTKTVRIFLAYIAFAFTKNNKLYCDEEELLSLIRQAMSDLEWNFPEDISQFDPHSIAKELSHTGILTRTYNGMRFSFSENTLGNHRQMQEYLTAYAIAAQYCDEEYNNMSPIEIFEDKYDSRQWREVILFIALMNNGRLRHELVNELISKVEDNPDDNYAYTNLLFDMVVNGANIKPDDKHRIYDVIFSEHITDKQIANIITLVKLDNKISAEFAAYIDEMFARSVESGDGKYGYAKAVIEAATALQQRKLPFARAEELMRSDNDVDIVAGSKILAIISWCKYAEVYNALYNRVGYYRYKMPTEWIELICSLIEKRRATTQLLLSVREAVLANFASFYDFFTDDDVINVCSSINDPEKAADCEIILSIAPVFDPFFQPSSAVDSDTRAKYLRQFDDEIKGKLYDKIVFTFCICASIGCFTPTEEAVEWDEIDEIYKALKNDGYVGKARYLQLDKAKWMCEDTQEFAEVLEISSRNRISDIYCWKLKERRNSYATYQNGSSEMKIAFPDDGITLAAETFLNTWLTVSVGTNNNLAYLLRRHELKSITMGEDSGVTVSPQQLLANGIRIFDEFSVINYALSISGIQTNETGDYEKGKEYLNSIKDSMCSVPKSWKGVVNFWRDRWIYNNEYEGIVVLTWLFSLGIISIESIHDASLPTIFTKLRKLNSDIEDFALFEKAIGETIN